MLQERSYKHNTVPIGTNRTVFMRQHIYQVFAALMASIYQIVFAHELRMLYRKN
jgi:hypothetical protein